MRPIFELLVRTNGSPHEVWIAPYCADPKGWGVLFAEPYPVTLEDLPARVRREIAEFPSRQPPSSPVPARLLRHPGKGDILIACTLIEDRVLRLVRMKGHVEDRRFPEKYISLESPLEVASVVKELTGAPPSATR